MSGRTDGTIDSIEEGIDRLAGGRAGRGPRIAGGDAAIVKVFPWFVVLCLVITAAGMAYIGEYTVPKLVEVLCLSFTLCFVALGIPCSQTMPRGAFSGWVLAAWALVLTAVLWLESYLVGDYYFADAIHNVLAAVGVDLTGLADGVVGFLGTLLVILFAPIGVVSVISAYLRRYVPSVLRTMNRHAEDGVRGKAEWFFKVPDIVDVKEVYLDPPGGGRAVDLRTALSVASYLFVLGLLVSSYLLVNPYFLSVMSWKTMLAITLALSMFTPALILPWQTFRVIGAKAGTDAPRDYPLWQGARARLFTTFAALGAFMMMFLLSVYLGNDVVDILRNYVVFLVPLLVTSLMYAALYANNFQRADRDAICGGFEEAEDARPRRATGSVRGRPRPAKRTGDRTDGRKRRRTAATPGSIR